MYANRDTLARHNGKPLLNDEGMQAISSLLEAHIRYDEKKLLHVAVINDINDQMAALEAEKQQLICDRERQQLISDQERNQHSVTLGNIASKPGRGNQIYAALLKTLQKNGKSSLWYPGTLTVADEMGRSLVAFDETLKSKHRPQPALVIEREKPGGHTNLFLSRTTGLSRGLKISTIPLKESLGEKSFIDYRDGLALPVRRNSIKAFQLHPNYSNEEPLSNFKYDKGPNLRQLEDSFNILLPQGTFHGVTYTIGTYDIDKSEIAEVRGVLGGKWRSESGVRFHVGRMSVEKALSDLQQSFIETSNDSFQSQHLFNKIGLLALGNI